MKTCQLPADNLPVHPHNRPSLPPQTTTLQNPSQNLSQTRPHPPPTIRVPPCHRNLLPFCRRRMPHQNDIVFANRPKMLFGKIIGGNYTSLLWSPYGDHWRNLRRIASIEILSIHRLNEFHHIRVDENKLLIGKLRSNSSPVIVKSLFSEVMLNIMMRMISGKSYFGTDDRKTVEEGKRFQEIVDETTVLAGASNVSDYLPVLSWLGAKSLEKKLMALQEKRDVFFQGLIEQLRKSRGTELANGRKTMIELLLSLQESEPEYYTDAMIRSFVMVMSPRSFLKNP
ncbi:hypothetical protein R6Q59_035844 [Mikania micrantha]